MRIVSFTRLTSAIAMVVLIFSFVPANTETLEITGLLPDAIGELRATGKAALAQPDEAGEKEYERELGASRVYRSKNGEKFVVTAVKTRTDRGAYSLFSSEAQKLLPDRAKIDGLGTAAVGDSSGRLLVYKGLTFVSVLDESRAKNSELMYAFARLVVTPFDNGDGEIPVLLKHLPDWEATQQRAVYAVSLPTLQAAAGQRPVLDSIRFEGGTESVTAIYGTSRLVIVELTTPQLASESDARIIERIKGLKESGQSIPSAYRRVGNYAVFVFDAPDETAATQLIDKISYEQVVQWLGDNPNWLIRAEREYRRTTAGVIVAVFKASGLSLLICLGIGGIFGSLVFRRRRAQQATAAAYSDAGGMLRLNIDEMTPEVDPARLLERGDG